MPIYPPGTPRAPCALLNSMLLDITGETRRRSQQTTERTSQFRLLCNSPNLEQGTCIHQAFTNLQRFCKNAALANYSMQLCIVCIVNQNTMALQDDHDTLACQVSLVTTNSMLSMLAPCTNSAAHPAF
jgi:hypothetical protein